VIDRQIQKLVLVLTNIVRSAIRQESSKVSEGGFHTFQDQTFLLFCKVVSEWNFIFILGTNAPVGSTLTAIPL
jgi:hypothetical protein